MSFLLVGNYGDGNMGDEALRAYFLSTFHAVDWRTVSAAPVHSAELPRLPCGIRSFFSPWWRTIAAIARSRGVVYGGGTLFTDLESLSACFIWASYAVTARVFRRPVFLAFQGVGPFRTRVGEWIARRVFASASFVSVRDEVSFERVRSWNLSVNPLLTFDPAYAFFSTHVRTEGPRRSLVLIPRANSNEAFFAAVRAKIHEHWDVIRIVLMQPNVREHAVALRLQQIANKAEVIACDTIDDVLSEVSRASHIVTQRFHGALAARAMGVPTEIIPLSEGDKLDVLAGRMNGDAANDGYLQRIQKGEECLRSAMEKVESLLE